MNELATISPGAIAPYVSPFSSIQAFESAQRMALMLSTVSFAPAQFQGEKNIGNIVIAMDMANRMGYPYMTLIQNMDVIYNKPAFKSTFIIGMVNAGSRFTPLEFETCGTPGQDDSGCRCKATDKATGKELLGTWITIKMAKAEGWFGRKDSKWPNMPEQMLRYRAACFWQRVYNPEATLGLPSSDEVYDSPPAPSRPEIRSVTPEPVAELPPPQFVPIPPVVLAPEPPQPTDPAQSNPDPTQPAKTDTKQLRIEVAAAFKAHGLAFKDVQAQAVTNQWWDDAATIGFNDLSKEALEFLVKRVEKISKQIKAIPGTDLPPVPPQ